MTRLSVIVEKFLRAEGLVYHRRCPRRNDPTVSFAVMFQTHGSRVVLEFFIRNKENLVQLVASAGATFQPERMAMGYEFVARANDGLKWGRLNIDSNGEVAFAHALSAVGFEISPETLKDMVAVVMQSYLHYHPAIFSVAYRDVTPLDAIVLVDGPTRTVVDQVVSQLMANATKADAAQGESDEAGNEEGGGNENR